MRSSVLRLLVLMLALCAVAPAAASAAVTVTYTCPFFCTYTVSGVSGNDDITAQTNPNAVDGIRFVAQGVSATDGPWSVAGTSCAETAASASQRTIDCTDNAVLVTINGNGGNDSVSNFRDNLMTFNGGPGDDTATSPSATTLGTIMNGGDGNDRLTGSPAADTLDGGSGGDTLSGAAGVDILNAGTGDDTVNGGDGDDAIDGGAGRDLITPGLGKDDVKGGDGFDEASYSERLATVNVTIDDIANDGEGGEQDNVHVDVEDLVGGRGNDVLTGSPVGNFLEGGDGSDALNGVGGRDSLSGGDGDDELSARDGLNENVDCGDGNDRAIGDQIDDLLECETADLSADLVADADGDGFAKPGDCNDGNPSVRPNATDVPDNGVDENCDGADAVNLDRDGDGSQRPADCDDSNAAVKPSASEVLGNAIDEDCSGVAEPFPSITSTVLNSFTAFASFSRVDRLKVTNVPAGATVRVVCKGRRCPKKSFTKRVSKRTPSLDIRKAFKGRRLGVRAKIEVRITKPATIGRFIRLTVRRAALPTSTSLCLPPGQTKPVEC